MLFEYSVYECVAFILKANYIKTRKRCFSSGTLTLLSIFCSFTSKARIKHEKKRLNLGTVFLVEMTAPLLVPGSSCIHVLPSCRMLWFPALVLLCPMSSGQQDPCPICFIHGGFGGTSSSPSFLRG